MNSLTTGEFLLVYEPRSSRIHRQKATPLGNDRADASEKSLRHIEVLSWEQKDDSPLKWKSAHSHTPRSETDART